MRTAAFETGIRESVERLQVLASRFVAAFLPFSYPEFAKEIPMRPRSHFSESRAAFRFKRSRKVAWPQRSPPAESAVV
jgi:hypothetical protein